MLTLTTELRMPFDLTTIPVVTPKPDEEHRMLVTKRLQYLYDTITGLREVKEPKRVEKEHIQFDLGQNVWKRESKYHSKGFTPVFASR